MFICIMLGRSFSFLFFCFSLSFCLSRYNTETTLTTHLIVVATLLRQCSTTQPPHCNRPQAAALTHPLYFIPPLSNHILLTKPFEVWLGGVVFIFSYVIEAGGRLLLKGDLIVVVDSPPPPLLEASHSVGARQERYVYIAHTDLYIHTHTIFDSTHANPAALISLLF